MWWVRSNRCGGLARAVALLALVVATPALARLAPADYRDVEISVPPGAALPMTTMVTDEHGKARRLGDLVTRPTVLVFADYTCRTLCGPIVAFVAEALRKSALTPGEQFNLLVIGLDPRDSAADAASLRRAHLGGDKALDAASHFVTADAATVTALTAALGYRYRYDKDDDQYVHPAAAYVLTAHGRVARVLTGIGLSGDDMRLALVEAGRGKIGTVRDRIRLLCSGFDPAHGTYNVLVSRLLAATGIVTILAMGGLFGVLLLMGRRRSA